MGRIPAHQWVSVAVALWGLFPDSFPRGRVAIEPHVLWAQLQQRRPISRSGRGRPRVGVNHPGGGILPRGPAAVELQRNAECNSVWLPKAIKVSLPSRREANLSTEPSPPARCILLISC